MALTFRPTCSTGAHCTAGTGSGAATTRRCRSAACGSWDEHHQAGGSFWCRLMTVQVFMTSKKRLVSRKP